jgi:clan AA aspartic protease (TIGR02281 family)
MIYKKAILSLFLIVFSFYANAQKVINLEDKNNTYLINCKLNGIPMKFIFDTGASDVSISLTEARFLIKQGIIKTSDFLEKTKYRIANGEIVEGMSFIIDKLEIEDVILENVKASVISNEGSPLLFGQSAIKKLGKYSINGNNLILEEFKTKEIDLVKSEGLKPILNTKAIEYLNELLTFRDIVHEGITNIKYNDYLNTFDYESKTILHSLVSDEVSFWSTEKWSIPLNKIKSIKCVINSEPRFAYFRFILSEEVYSYKTQKEKGKILNKSKKMTKEVTFSTLKKMNDENINELINVTKDVFNKFNIEIEYQ